MRLVKLSSKNQVTIPKVMLDMLNMGAVKKLLIEEQDSKLILIPVRGSITQQTAGSLADVVSEDKKKKSLDEIMEKTKKLTVKQLIKK